MLFEAKIKNKLRKDMRKANLSTYNSNRPQKSEGNLKWLCSFSKKDQRNLNYRDKDIKNKIKLKWERKKCSKFCHTFAMKFLK